MNNKDKKQMLNKLSVARFSGMNLRFFLFFFLFVYVPLLIFRVIGYFMNKQILKQIYHHDLERCLNLLPLNMLKVEYNNLIPDCSKDAMDMFEREHIIKILKRTKNNKEEAAKILDISLSSLYRKMDELHIKNLL